MLVKIDSRFKENVEVFLEWASFSKIVEFPKPASIRNGHGEIYRQPSSFEEHNRRSCILKTSVDDAYSCQDWRGRGVAVPVSACLAAEFRNSGMCVGIAVFLLLISATLGRAQVITDGSVGPIRSLGGPAFTIDPSLGLVKGTNVFQSFGTFNIGAGEGAIFTGQGVPDVRNIIARITGGPSNIDGTISTRDTQANLYLINPFGLVFGPHATLNVNGSFFSTTADYVLFANGSILNSSIDSVSTFSAARPEAFGFLRSRPASIEAQAQLRVPGGQTLGLIGGDVILKNSGGYTLAAPGGTLYVASVGRPAQVNITPDRSAGSFGGTVQLAPSTNISVTQDNGPPGSVYIRAGRFVMESGSKIDASNTSPERGGRVDIEAADLIRLENGGNIQVDTTGTGTGSELSLRTQGDLVITGADSGIYGTTSGSGTLGLVQLKAGGEMTVSALGTVALSSSPDGGPITGLDIQAGVLKVVGSEIRVSNTGPQKAGAITISSPEILIDGQAARVFSETSGSGDSAGIDIQAKTLTLRSGGGLISNSHPDATGSTGTISVTATNSIDLNGSFITNWVEGSGNAGGFSISSPSITIENGAKVSSRALESGKGGDIRIVTDELVLQGQTIGRTENTEIQTWTTNGPGGVIDIQASKGVTLTGGAVAPRGTGIGGGPALPEVTPDVITNETYGSGNAGEVRIQTPVLALHSGALVRSDSGRNILTGENVTGNAGDIQIRVDELRVDGGSRIETATFTAGGGGTIKIDAARQVSVSGRGSLADGSQSPSGIFSDTFDEGNAGSITLQSHSLDVNGGVIGVSTHGGGNAGTIALHSDDVAVTGGGRVESSSSSAGSGGQITVAGGSLLIAGKNESGPSGLFSSASETGPAGGISVTVKSADLRDGATISARSSGTGQAGQIYIGVDESLSLRNAALTTSGTTGGGGTITIDGTGANAARASMVDSTLTTSVSGGKENAGNILIGTKNGFQSIVVNGSELRANADRGTGGDITLASSLILISPQSVITASSGNEGVNGTVNIESPVSGLSDNFTPLRTGFLPDLQAARCGGGMTAKSSFIVDWAHVDAFLDLSPLSYIFPSLIVEEPRCVAR
jgi:filamentous hemagglutinin family protein